MQDEVWLRLGCALLAGAALGLERESHGRAAGLRTTVLVCLAPCIGMLLSDGFYRAAAGAVPAGGWRPDPMRLAAGVLSGMGFLGGGVILKQGDLVRGVTTASILWLASMLGLTFGAGLYGVGFTGLALALIVVAAFPYLERCVPSDWYSVLTVVTTSPDVTAQALTDLLARHGVTVKQVLVEVETAAARKTLTLRVRYKKRDLVHLPEQVAAELAALPGVQRVSCR